MSLEGAIAAHRFGLGARPGELDRASRSPKTWLLTQVNVPADQPVPLGGGNFKNSGDLVVELFQYQRDRAMEARNGTGEDPVKTFFKVKAKEFLDELAARYAHGFTTETPFAERLVWFWSNHFVVSAQNPRAITFVGAFEREAIRPHITGKFEDMLLAAASHPAMLLYLDNAQSIGPHSVAGKYVGKGLNENLGRDLAHDPATARHIARKMAVHFIADDPPAESVARLEKTFKETGGDLRALAHAVVEDPNAWKPGPGKMRAPVEYVTAGYRLLGLPKGDTSEKQIRGALAATRLMGQTPLAPPAPKGWPDTSDAWSGPDAVLTRIEWARQVGAALPPNIEAAAIAEMGLGPLLQPTTRTAMARAESQQEALALLLSSPEFQRR